jgi:uncharacterized protein (DUF433 family)
MDKLLSRTTMNSAQCGGKPCIRGLRIRVVDILDLMSAGLSHAQIMTELPDLEADDIKAALTFAGRQLEHPTLAA